MELIQLDAAAPEDRLQGAMCTLDAAELPARLREWADLRDRAIGIRAIPGGVALSLAANEPINQVADLVARESACCAFYTFTIRVEGEARELQISAGEGREIAVRALVGMAGA